MTELIIIFIFLHINNYAIITRDIKQALHKKYVKILYKFRTFYKPNFVRLNFRNA